MSNNYIASFFTISEDNKNNMDNTDIKLTYSKNEICSSCATSMFEIKCKVIIFYYKHYITLIGKIFEGDCTTHVIHTRKYLYNLKFFKIFWMDRYKIELNSHQIAIRKKGSQVEICTSRVRAKFY